MRLGSRGQMLTPIKFLVFAVMFITMFTLFQVYYSGSASAIENLKNVDTNLPGQSSKDLTIMYLDNVYVTGFTDVPSYFNIRGNTFTLTAEHYSTEYDNTISVFITFPDGTTSTSWTERVVPTLSFLGTAFVNGTFGVIPSNSPDLYIPVDTMKANIDGWGDYDLKIAVGPIARTGSTTNGEVYGSSAYSASANYVAPNFITGLGHTIGSWLKEGATSVFSAVAGDSGAKFVDTMSNVMTVNLPGIPDVIRIPIAVVFNVALLYILAALFAGVVGMVL